jgi:hypothetical protein
MRKRNACKILPLLRVATVVTVGPLGGFLPWISLIVEISSGRIAFIVRACGISLDGYLPNFDRLRPV